MRSRKSASLTEGCELPMPGCAPGGRADTPLETWHMLRNPRCGPRCAGRLAEAILVMLTREIAR